MNVFLFLIELVEGAECFRGFFADRIKISKAEHPWGSMISEAKLRKCTIVRTCNGQNSQILDRLSRFDVVSSVLVEEQDDDVGALEIEISLGTRSRGYSRTEK